MMSNYFSYLWEANLVFLILYGFYFLVLRQKTAPRFNRYFLLFSLFFALVIPLISIPFSLPLIESNSNALSPISEAWNFLPELIINNQKSSASTLLFNSFAALSWVEILYISGVLISFVLTSLRLNKLFRLLRRLSFTTRQSDGTTYHITDTNGSFPTFSFLNYLFWDNTVAIAPTEEQQILHHELAHIKQRHSLDLLFLEVARALLWFNPFLHAYRQSLMQVHEHLADHYAVERSEKESYLQLMVKQTLRQANIPLASLFFQHNTLNRIHMLHTTPKHPILKALLSAGLVVSLLFVVSCEDEPKVPGLDTDETPQLVQNEQNLQTTPKPAENEVFEVVEEQPLPKGGMEAFYKTIGENLKYPEEAASKGMEGRVYVQFIVDEMGNVSDVKTVKSVINGSDKTAEEAIRKTAEEAIRKTSWEPGRQRGKAVKVRMVMPIVFKL